MQCACAILSSVACEALRYFSTLSNNGHDLKTLLYIKYVFRFSLQLLPETFLTVRRTERDLITNVNIIIIYLCTAIGLLPGGSGYFTCTQNMKLVTTKFNSGGLHEKHVVATWNVGNRLSVCL